MPIKQSSLEQKIFYRVAKVIFLILPFLIAAVLFLKGYISIPELFQKNIFKISPQEILDLLQKNIVYIAYVVIGLVAYFLILNATWRLFLYVAFGGLEDDVKKKISEAVQPAPAIVQQSASVQNNGGEVIGWIILIILIILIATYSGTPSKPEPQPTTPTCISTGCGKLWRCTGTYYVSEKQMRVDACYSSGSRPRDLYSSWSGTCRQCP